jgi:hypothetical protein
MLSFVAELKVELSLKDPDFRMLLLIKTKLTIYFKKS